MKSPFLSLVLTWLTMEVVSAQQNGPGRQPEGRVGGRKPGVSVATVEEEQTLDYLLFPEGGGLSCDGFTEPWVGITCVCPDGEGTAQQCEVVTIYLNDTGLAGTLPDRLATLPSLQVLNLSSNQLTGTVPASWFTAGAFPALRQMLLRDNNLTGPLPWGSDVKGDAGGQPVLPALEMIDLGQNGLTGPLPPVHGVHRVQYLLLDRCSFGGTLPPDLFDGADGGLSEVWLHGNQFTGGLPPEWALSDASDSLRVLRLNGNRLSGTLPEAWAKFSQIEVLALQENNLAGAVPVDWSRRWSAPPSLNASAPMLVVWPGNEGMCGPVWGAQATPLGTPLQPSENASKEGPGPGGMNRDEGALAFMVAVFAAQAALEAPGLSDELVSEDDLALRLSNTLGSCYLPCKPPASARVVTNIYDLATARGLSLHALLRVNSPAALAASNKPQQVVALPCPSGDNASSSPTVEGPAYLGGDLAFQRAAFDSQAPISFARLMQVASVVATPPGQRPQWGSFSQRGGSPLNTGSPFWAVDLGASLEVSLLLITPSQRMSQLSIYVGDDSNNVLANQLCLQVPGVEPQGAGPVPLLVPPGCRGRYVILSGELHLADVQVYPVLANAAANKPVAGGVGPRNSSNLFTDSSSSLTDGNLTICVTFQGQGAAEGPVWAAVDLQYMALVGPVRVVSTSNFSGLELGLSNSSSPLDKSSPLLVKLTSVPLGPPGSASGAVGVVSGLARYVVLQWYPPSEDASLELCEVDVYLLQGPTSMGEVQEGGASGGKGEDEDHHSSVGIIVGATLGGLLGVAALATCLACCFSYRTWRRSQRQHGKLAAQLAKAQAASAPSGGVESKDGLVAAAALQAMVQAAPPRSELQLLKDYVGMRLRAAHDSAGSLCSCCWAPAPRAGGELPGRDGSLSPTASSGVNSRRRLLPLYYLSRGRRRGGGRFGSVMDGEISVDVTSNRTTTEASEKLPDDGTPKAPAQQQQLGEAGDIEMATQTSAPTMAQLSNRLSAELGGLVDYSEIELGRFLGDGSFGSVYLARWKHVQVAVKVLQRIDPKLLHAASAGLGSRVTRSGRIAEATLKELAKEAGIMASLRHPCVVSYIGACLEPPCLVMEYCARGSVYGVLSGAAEDAQAAAALSWPRLMRFAWDASKGMLHLHTLRPPIVHRDLKSANLLVDLNWHVKISDFNLSRVMEPASTISTLSTANPRWMSPEVIKGETPTLAADVFSFGVVLWELMTWQLPWGSDKNPFQIANLVSAGARLDVPPPDQLPAGQLAVYDEYVALMRECWAQDPDARPTFSSIVTRLQAMTVRVVQGNSRSQVQ